MPNTLIDQLETADIGSTELDGKLMQFDSERVHMRISNTHPDCIIDDLNGGQIYLLPKYTTSIDAAISLLKTILPNYRWEVTNVGYDEGYCQNNPTAWLSSPFSSNHTQIKGVAKTEALALCVAMLSALEQEKRYVST